LLRRKSDIAVSYSVGLIEGISRLPAFTKMALPG